MSAEVGQSCKNWESQLQLHNVDNVTHTHTHTHFCKAAILLLMNMSVCLSVYLFILIYSVDILNECIILLCLGGNYVLKNPKYF
jgi:hypothetical protein